MRKNMRGLVGAAALLLGLALAHPGIAAAHGTTSGEDDPCIRQVGERVVHFNAYQPQYQVKDQYCTDIPKEGETFLVVDLVDPALRNELVGMRIVKGSGSKETEDQIVADIRPSTHPDGVLRSEVRLDEGLYTVTIATEKQNLMKRPQYLLRVHMTDYQQAGANRGRAPIRGVARSLARIQAPPLDVAAELVDRPPVLESRRSAMNRNGGL